MTIFAHHSIQEHSNMWKWKEKMRVNEVIALELKLNSAYDRWLHNFSACDGTWPSAGTHFPLLIYNFATITHNSGSGNRQNVFPFSIILPVWFLIYTLPIFTAHHLKYFNFPISIWHLKSYPIFNFKNYGWVSPKKKNQRICQTLRLGFTKKKKKKSICQTLWLGM